MNRALQEPLGIQEPWDHPDCLGSKVNVEAQEVPAIKENQVLLVTPGTKDRRAHRALKETQDLLGRSDPKANRASKDRQDSQDHRVHQVPLAKLEEKDTLDSRVKREMMVVLDLKDQLDPRDLLAPQG